MAFIASGITASAYDFEVDGLCYDKGSEPGTVKVAIKPGKYDGISYYRFETVDIPESVTYNGETYKVTEIGDKAFAYRSELKSVTFPNTIEKIGEEAFTNAGISSLTLPESVKEIAKYAFRSCDNLKRVSIPESVTSIEWGAFERCNKLRKVTIPASVKRMDSWVLSGCGKLKEIHLEPAEVIEGVDNLTFDGIPASAQIVVPTNLIDAYTKIINTGDEKYTITDTYKAPEKKPLAGVKPVPVDMGLSVQWADVDLGASTKKTSGKFMALEDTEIEAYLGEGWSMPTKSDFDELFENTVAQLYLTQAGAPLRITFTSKKNGAKINFYFPKTAFISGGNKIANPTREGTYMMAHACTDQTIMMSVAAKLPSHHRQNIQRYVTAAKVKSMNIADWPDEMQEWMEENTNGMIVDSKFLWGCKCDFVDDVNKGTMQCFIRPVYEADEMSDED